MAMLLEFALPGPLPRVWGKSTGACEGDLVRKALLALAFLAIGAAGIWWLRPTPLLLLDHRRAQAEVRFGIWDPTWYRRALWARRGDYGDPRLGPTLLADPVVVSHRIADLMAKDKADSSEESILLYRGEWALFYAGLRRQGLSLKEIVARPEGPAMVLGVLAAEANPPKWWTDDFWLARPGLEPLEAQQAVRWIWPLMRKNDLGLMTALIYDLSVHPDLMTYAETSQVLVEWVKQNGQYFNANHSLSMEAALHVRERLHELLGGGPGVRFVLDPRLKPETEQVIRQFLNLAGVSPVEGLEAIELQQAVVSFAEVTSAKITSREDTVREWKHGPGRYQTYYVDRQVTRKDRESAGTAPEEVVSLVLEVKGESFALPPCGDPLKEDLQNPEKLDVLTPWRWGRSAYAFSWEPRM